MKLLVVISVEYEHREVVFLASRILFLVSGLEKYGETSRKVNHGSLLSF